MHHLPLLHTRLRKTYQDQLSSLACTNPAADRCIVEKPNPVYEHWIERDQALLGYIFS
jgi:hypothetical protein